MKKRFGQLNTLIDGSPGKDVILPPLDAVQRDPDMVVDWIDYSTLDAEATYAIDLVLFLQSLIFALRFRLYKFLRDALTSLSWHGAKVRASLLLRRKYFSNGSSDTMGLLLGSVAAVWRASDGH